MEGSRPADLLDVAIYRSYGAAVLSHLDTASLRGSLHALESFFSHDLRNELSCMAFVLKQIKRGIKQTEQTTHVKPHSNLACDPNMAIVGPSLQSRYVVTYVSPSADSDTVINPPRINSATLLPAKT